MAVEQYRSIEPQGKVEKAVLDLTKSWWLRAFFAVDAAVTGYSAYQNVPGIHERVDDAYLAMLNTIHPKTAVLDSVPQVVEIKQPVSNSFNDKTLQPVKKFDIKREGRKAAIAINERAGKYEMTPPPNRLPENLSDIPTTTSIAKIPHIPEVDTRIKNANLKWGFSGSLENQQVLTGNDQQHLYAKTIHPSISISGYLVAKEKQPDGSIMFAIELPYLDSPKDILSRDNDSSTPQLIKRDLRSANLPPSEHIQVGGSIVWIKLFEGKNPTYEPFDTTVSWGDPMAAPTNKAGSGDKPLAEFSRIGDPIFANVPLDPNLLLAPDHLDKLISSYVELYGNDVTQVKQKLGNTVSANMENAQKLVADSGKEIPLETQLKEKIYVFTAGSAGFIP